MKIKIVPKNEIDRIRMGISCPYASSEIIADICRFNTINMVKKAGSGHLGTSLSAMDIFVWLYLQVINVEDKGPDNPDRDVFFSSKGHDVPGLYAVLYAIGILPEDQILLLRRHGGLDGHPHVSIQGLEVNSGSLGMGISKARGIAYAKKLSGKRGRIFVMTGDGELQEGQNYEALRNAANSSQDNITVIVDHNKVQSDKPVEKISALGDIEAIFNGLGWHTQRCDGHDFRSFDRALKQAEMSHGKPQIIIADTIKGKGISFMEHPCALRDGNGLYKWHSGAPDDESFYKALQELEELIQRKARDAGVTSVEIRDIDFEKKPGGVSDEFIADSYGETLVRLAHTREDLVVLDADLAADCRIRRFECTFPKRFIECGIAEQDMVSVAGGLALQGFLPVVNSFASFLASRANEQIYTNAGENTKIIYACHYAGLIPAGPGLSHQSLRDISLFSSLPNCIIMQPCNIREAELLLEFCVNTATENCMIRINIGPSPRRIKLPSNYKISEGKGCVIIDGESACIISYGPVMLNEAIDAARHLRAKGTNIMVINMPWLNRFDTRWLEETLAGIPDIYILEDHFSSGGLGERLIATLAMEEKLMDKRFKVLGIKEFPAWGTPTEVLKHHELDGESIASQIHKRLEFK